MKKQKEKNDELNMELVQADLSDDYPEDFDEEDDIPDPTQMDFEQVKSSYFGTSDWTGGLPPTAKVNEIIRAEKQKKERERILGIVHVILYVLCFSGITLCMAEYGNSRTTDLEVFYSRFAMIFFIAILWTLQRVRLFNWQSLLLSAAFAPYAVFYSLVEGKTDVYVMLIVVELITRWMMLMLLADIAIAKKIRLNHRFVRWSFAILCVTAVFSLMNGNGGFAPIALLYFIILCFIPVSLKEWEKFTDCLIYTGIFLFVLMTVFSFTGNPMALLPRDYYMLVDDLGQFYGFCIGLAAFGMVRFAKKYGRISFSYFLCAAWLIASVVMVLYKGTTGIFLGILLMCLVLFLFGPKMGKFPLSLIRPVIALLVLIGMAVGIGIFANMVIQDSFDTVAFAESVSKSPLTLFANFAEDITGKVEMVHRGSGGYGDIIKPKTIGAFLNVFMDSRIGIFFETIGALNWDGHILVGVYADSFVMATKNQYIQYLYEFGIFGGALNILLYVSIWIGSLVQYIKHRKERFLLPTLLGAMMLGTWVNVSSGIFYPLVFFFLLSAYPVLVDLRPMKHKKKAKKAEEKPEVKREKVQADEKSVEKTEEKNEKETAPETETAKTENTDNTDNTEDTDNAEQINGETESDAEETKAEESEKELSDTEKSENEIVNTKEPETKEPETEKKSHKENVKKPIPAKREVELLPEEKKHKKREFKEVEGRPLDREQLEDEAIIAINPIAGQSDSDE